MAELTKRQKVLGFDIRKKLGGPGDPDPWDVNGIYQRRTTKLRGRRSIKMVFYSPTNPRTPAQQANRQRMVQGVPAWLALTDEQKAVYNERAKKLPFSGYNLFMREFVPVLSDRRLYGAFYYGEAEYGDGFEWLGRFYGQNQYGAAFYGATD